MSQGQPSAALWVALAGSVAIIIGSLAPWATALGESVPGTESDGAITIAFGALALLLVWWAWAAKNGKVALACATIGALVFVVGVIDWASIRDTRDRRRAGEGRRSGDRS